MIQSPRGDQIGNWSIAGSDVNLVSRSPSTSQMSVLPCSVRLNATRRPSGDTEGFARSECSGVAIEPRARPERSNHVSCVVTGPPKRYTTCPVFEAEKGRATSNPRGFEANESANAIGSPLNSLFAGSDRRATSLSLAPEQQPPLGRVKAGCVGRRQAPRVGRIKRADIDALDLIGPSHVKQELRAVADERRKRMTELTGIHCCRRYGLAARGWYTEERSCCERCESDGRPHSRCHQAPAGPVQELSEGHRQSQSV